MIPTGGFKCSVPHFLDQQPLVDCTKCAMSIYNNEKLLAAARLGPGNHLLGTSQPGMFKRCLPWPCTKTLKTPKNVCIYQTLVLEKRGSLRHHGSPLFRIRPFLAVEINHLISKEQLPKFAAFVLFLVFSFFQRPSACFSWSPKDAKRSFANCVPSAGEELPLKEALQKHSLPGGCWDRLCYKMTYL